MPPEKATQHAQRWRILFDLADNGAGNVAKFSKAEPKAILQQMSLASLTSLFNGVTVHRPASAVGRPVYPNGVAGVHNSLTFLASTLAGGNKPSVDPEDLSDVFFNLTAEQRMALLPKLDDAQRNAILRSPQLDPTSTEFIPSVELLDFSFGIYECR